MGTEAHVIVVGPYPFGLGAALDLARQRIDDLEVRWSRFVPSSEIGLVNAMAGTSVRVSPVTILLIRRAIEAARRTGGRFDPTVLGDVVRAGYASSFERSSYGEDDRRPDDRGRGVDRIEIDTAADLVRLPEGVGFDPGGIGKGLATDLVIDELRGRGIGGACVNLGGDLRVTGRSPHGTGWTVSVADPFDGSHRCTISLQEGAVATSGRTRRTFGDGAHHLIDPSTGRPARSGLASVTVVASSAWAAEALAKAAFMAGPVAGPEVLEEAGADGFLVRDDGGVVRTSRFDRFTGVAR
jgi:thiamine biosynthesis lipoprotein